MYIMITNRCNMSCPHCVYACSEEGIDMSFDMYKDILLKWGKIFKKSKGSQILIGGGEPTIHPDFWSILLLSVSKGRTWIAVNGKETDITLKLIEFAKKDIINLTLSVDKWHDPIDNIVVEKMKEGLVKKKDGRGWKFKNREIRTVINLKHGGRCKNNNLNCPCPRVHVKPNGDIYGCGCENSTLVGTVEKGFFKKYEPYIPLFKEPPIFRQCSKKWLPK